MSLSGALTSAVTGIDAQSIALGSISDNISNSQTVGYKRVETDFSTLLTVSNAVTHQPGGVTSKPLYTNDVQGTVQKSSVETNLAISGGGFFAVSRVQSVNGTALPTFEPDPLYTRAGDFKIDNNGFLVNGGGYFLNGWSVVPQTGVVQKNQLVQIRLNDLKANPQATQNITYAANLPTNPSAVLDTDPVAAGINFAPTKVNIFDAQGAPHALDVNWTKVAGTNDTYTVKISSSDAAITSITPGSATTITFNVVDNASTGARAGSIASIGGVAGAVGSSADVPITVNFGGSTTSSQAITLNLGRTGVAEQTTLFTGTDVDFVSAQQDGLPPGSFRDIEIDTHGLVTLNFDNGARKAEFQVPLVQFSNPNGLQAQNGNAFSTTVASGTPAVHPAGGNGTGTVIASSVEGANVDIAAEFTKLIQTQRAYEANTKVVTTTDSLLQETNNLIR